jgi:S1-C subfamily serine protease
MTTTSFRLTGAVLLIILLSARPAAADDLADAIARLHKKISPALVAVTFGLETEDAKTAEFTFSGITVTPRGMVMVPISELILSSPRNYLKRVEIVHSARPDDPVDARLIGYNDTFTLAFVEPTKPSDQPMAAIDFSDSAEPPPLGQPIIALGLLPKDMGYRCTFAVSRAGPFIGDEDFIAVGLGRNVAGMLLFTPPGRLVGVGRWTDSGAFFHDERFSSGFMSQPQAVRAAVLAPAVKFAIEHRRDRPQPWLGVAGLSVASREICEAYGLPPDTVAIIVGAVVDGYPAAKAGLQPRDFILRFNDRSLVRGATDDETLEIWTRLIKHMNVGEEVTLTVWRDEPEKEPRASARAAHQHEVIITLAETPTPPARAGRVFNEALGLTVRELVFRDRFGRRLDDDTQGVVVARIVQGGPADTAELQMGDVVQKVDETAIANLEDYRRVINEKLAARPRELIFSVLRGTSEWLIVRVELPVSP